jgi:hypothetical protein
MIGVKGGDLLSQLGCGSSIEDAGLGRDRVERREVLSYLGKRS